MQNSHRMDLSNKKRIVIKIGSTSLTHPETGAVNLGKIEQLARQISDLKGRRGKADFREEREACLPG